MNDGIKRPVFAACMALLFGLIPTLFGAFTLYRDWQFSGAVEKVSGVVDDLRVTYGKHTSYHVRYHYPIGPSLTLGVSKQISTGLYHRLRIGQPLPIEYLATDKSVSRIDDARQIASDRRACWQAWPWASSSACSLMLLFALASLDRPSRLTSRWKKPVKRLKNASRPSPVPFPSSDK